MAFLPDEARSLPPPPLLNKGSAWLGALPEAPRELAEMGTFLSFPAAGVHRQILLATVGWFVGYQLVKRAQYIHAKVDRELFEYIRHHPEDFKAAG
ncbi:NDUCR dehydrogenase, partial [Dasyornis broadbenti]|nr:NDUCR dehydrogenase [Dasyornis broadbenti]